MSVIKINAITVPPDSGHELAHRFAARAGAVDGQDGFEGFELLRPTDERTTWLVVTRWRDEEAFQAWVSSAAFGRGHRGSSGDGEGKAPVGMSSELWSYAVAGGSAGAQGGLSSRADVLIERPERWAKQLVSHLSNKAGEARESDAGDVLAIGDGQGTVRAEDDRVVLLAEAPDDASLHRVEHVLGSHLERFAKDLDITVSWVR